MKLQVGTAPRSSRSEAVARLGTFILPVCEVVGAGAETFEQLQLGFCSVHTEMPLFTTVLAVVAAVVPPAADVEAVVCTPPRERTARSMSPG
jgi:hypothetical protein